MRVLSKLPGGVRLQYQLVETHILSSAPALEKANHEARTHRPARSQRAMSEAYLGQSSELWLRRVEGSMAGNGPCKGQGWEANQDQQAGAENVWGGKEARQERWGTFHPRRRVWILSCSQ